MIQSSSLKEPETILLRNLCSEPLELYMRDSRHPTAFGMPLRRNQDDLLSGAGGARGDRRGRIPATW